MERTTNDIYRAGFVCFAFGLLGILNSESDGIFTWVGTWGVLIVGMAILLIPEQKLPAIFERFGESLEVV